MAARSRHSPPTGLAPMEAEYIKRSRYGPRFHACSFFLLALLVRLSGELHDLNYNNCLLEQFPTPLFLVLNLAHMPEYPFFPEPLAEIGHRGPRATIRALWVATWALSCRPQRHWPQRRRWLQRRRWPHRRWPCMEALAIEALVMEALTTEAPVTEALAT